MKKKELKKIAKKIYNYAKEFDKEKNIQEEIPIDQSSMENCPYDEQISEKFFKFVTNLIKLKDKLAIDHYREGINIFCDLHRYKRNNNNNTFSNKYQTDSNFEIRIDSGGFRIRRDYGSYISFSDPNFMEKIKPVIKEKSEIINKEKIVETIDDLTIELGLIRENNLDEILS